MPSIDDLREVLRDLADDAPTAGGSVISPAERATEPVELVPAAQRKAFPRPRRGTLLTGLAVAAMLLVALIVLPFAFQADPHQASDHSSHGVCAGTVSICITEFGTPWSVTLRLDGYLAPPIGSESVPPPASLHVTEGTAVGIRLTVGHKPRVPLRNVYLFAHAGSFTIRGATPSGHISVLLHHAALMPAGHSLRRSWTAAPIGNQRHLYVGLSFQLGKSDRQVDISEIDVKSTH